MTDNTENAINENSGKDLQDNLQAGAGSDTVQQQAPQSESKSNTELSSEEFEEIVESMSVEITDTF